VALNLAQGAPWAAVTLALISLLSLAVLLVIWVRPASFSVAIQVAFLGNNLGSLAQTLLFGGLLASGMNMIWAFLGVLGALLVSGYRVALIWLVAFVVSVVLGVVVPTYWEGLYELDNVAVIAAANVVTVMGAVFLLLVYFIRQRDRFQQESDDLLLNILPQPVADRLKAGEGVIADRVEHVSVLFADLVDSTPLSESLTPTDLVEFLNEVFTRFDDLADELGVEKIKTIGDAYMVVGGLPEEREDHLEAIAEMALRMREELANHASSVGEPMQMRYGIHTGPVVAGVIGRRKFSYDLWGDTVNTAARMESHGVPGKIHVTTAVRDALGGAYDFETRGTIKIKGKGLQVTHFLTGR
jgi:guanylate cyclase